MKCPHCPEVTLVMSDRQGVEIDYCPQCRGIWLDRGELDKLLERAATLEAAPRAAQPVARDAVQPPPQMQPQRRPDFVDSDHGGYHRQGHGHGQRRKSWLSEIFD